MILVVGIYNCDSTVFLRSAHCRRPVTVVRTVACKCIAGGARHECAHSSGGQLQRSRVMSCIHKGTEAWASVWFPGSGESRDKEGAGWTHVAGVSKRKYLCSKSW